MQSVSVILIRRVVCYQGLVVQTGNSAIQWIYHYTLDGAIGFPNKYRVDSDLSGGQRYPSFKRPRPAGPSFSKGG